MSQKERGSMDAVSGAATSTAQAFEICLQTTSPIKPMPPAPMTTLTLAMVAGDTRILANRVPT